LRSFKKGAGVGELEDEILLADELHELEELLLRLEYDELQLENEELQLENEELQLEELHEL